jgi:uncharacterized protein (TIGR03435 family)
MCMNPPMLRHLGMLAVITLSVSSAQTFEVASIRLNRSATADSNLDSAPGGRFTATAITVRELIRLAFNVKDYQIERAPGWIDNRRYDIAARSPVSGKPNLEEERSLVRSLLTDRFQLATHRETRQAQVYLLVVGKNGSRLTEHNEGSGARTRTGCGHLAGTRLTTDVLATVLSRNFECEVLNRTGLPGKYDFQLDWTPDSGPCPDAPEGPRPSIFTAIQEQLGLKLESAKGPTQFLVVDHIAGPSEN